MTYMHALEIQDEKTLINTFKIVGRDYIKSILGQLVTEGRPSGTETTYTCMSPERSRN